MTTALVLIKKQWVILTLFILTAITALSLWPLDKLPAFPGSDKTHHFIAYALLIFPAALRKPPHWKLIALLFIAYSGVIELIQPYVNRYGEWLDLAANTGGILCGLFIAWLAIILWLTPSDNS
jgi:hypothetical protein